MAELREPIRGTENTMDIIIKMSEGIPGAISVLSNLVKEKQAAAIPVILSMDVMNIRGSQIWVGYKDHCGQDLDKFVECATYKK